MKKIDEIYEELTGVNIEEQRDIWDERGKGYYGEYLVFCTLFDHLSDNSKILMNIEIPTDNGLKTTEIDLLLIHETGLYCFEMKYYKGDIYCNFDQDYWVQAFRTTENHSFYNPVRQNEYHISALKKMFPEVPVHSFILFTNPDVTLHDGRKGVFSCKELPGTIVCTLDWFAEKVGVFLYDQGEVFSTEKIDSVFKSLEPYSKIKQKINVNNEQVMTMAEFIGLFPAVFNKKIAIAEERANKRAAEAEAAAAASIKKSNSIRNITVLLAVVGLIIGLTGAIVLPQVRIKQVEDKYAEFFAKFEEVDSSAILDNLMMSDIASVDEVEFYDVDGADAKRISFRVTGLSEDYGIGLNETSRLIVQMENGDVKEVDIFTDSLDFDMILRSNAWLTYAYNGKSFTIKSVAVPDLNDEEISYIKMSNISVFQKENYSSPLRRDYELEVYKK